MVDKGPAQFARRQVIKPTVAKSPTASESTVSGNGDGSRRAADLDAGELAAILGRESAEPGPAGTAVGLSVAGADADAAISEKEFRAYMGTNAAAFLSSFEASRDRHGGITLGWSWACLFMGPVWLAYRKLWLPLALFLGLSLGGTFGAIGGMAAGLPLWAYVLGTLTLSMMAKSLCVNGAYAAARRAEALGHHGGDRLAQMQAIGGTSRLAAFVAIFVFLAFDILSYGLIFGGLGGVR